jgi:putative ABC transport system substrate-binding protein
MPRDRWQRRRFIALVAGAAAWRLAGRPARAQPKALPMVGVLGLSSAAENAPYTAWFIRGLNEAGFAEGRNVAIEYRWAEGDYDRLEGLARELVRDHPAVIVATGGTPPLRAAMAAAGPIPIVFSLGDDPVKQGIVASMNRPGGNLTGTTFTSAPLGAKRLELLRELLPGTRLVAHLANPNSEAAATERRQLESIAGTIGVQILALDVRSAADIGAAFTNLVQHHADALLVPPDALLAEKREEIVGLAAHRGVPAVYFEREFVAEGGLMSYGVPLRDSYRQAGIYAGRILDGAKAGDLPVVQATRFELVLNGKTAKTLGIQFPDKLLAIADEVIE